MKYLILVGDGMADYPISKLGNRTPLQAAHTPNIDHLCRNGRTGLLRTIPRGLEPSSDIANLSILGYDSRRYKFGRGALEAAGRGIPLSSTDVAFRLNLITESEGQLDDYSAGQISTSQALEIIEFLKASIGVPGELDFYGGVGYRHLLVLRNCPSAAQVCCVPPHHVQGREIDEILPTSLAQEAQDAVEELRRMVSASRRILENYSTNLARREQGKKPANMMWPWGPGRQPSMPPFQTVHGIRGSAISAVDIIKGIAKLVSMRVIDVPGATGYFDTDYEKKADYALGELEESDLVFIHVEAPDEASHEGNCELKIRTIEDFDRRLLGRILDHLDMDFVMSVLPDHYTSLESRRHLTDPVPFLVFSTNQKGDRVSSFDEVSVREGSFGLLEGHRLMRVMLEIERDST